MPSASKATTTRTHSHREAHRAQLGDELALRLDRIWYWASETCRADTPQPARDHYQSLLIEACTALWTAIGQVAPAEDVPREHRLVVGLARERIAYQIWVCAAIVGERDYTLGCQIQQCGAVWLDSAAELSQLISGGAS